MVALGGKNTDSAKVFLKKRAPLYLAVIAIAVIFVIPELTAGKLYDYIPKDLEGNEGAALEAFLAYRGPNNSGKNLVDVLAEKIAEDYPDQKIYNDSDTVVEFEVVWDDIEEKYRIRISFETEKEDTVYEWLLDDNIPSPVNSESKRITELVNYG